ncbi:hypothetical protein GCM10010244_80640 [Streptomyces coeruleorubidus]|nr:hypothetical protein GCM10010244_80640 [Streptomyces bellus]
MKAVGGGGVAGAGDTCSDRKEGSLRTVARPAQPLLVAEEMQPGQKARCHSTGQAGHHDGSVSSSCSRRSSVRALADDPTGRPSARRCSISAAFRAAALAFLRKIPTR